MTVRPIRSAPFLAVMKPSHRSSSPSRLAVAALALVAIGTLGLLLPAPADAHHLMGFFHLQPGPISGLISGLMHPLLGPDHLVFLLAIGLVALSRPAGWIVALLGAGLGGVAVALLQPGLTLVEPLVALSLAATGLVLLRRLPAAVLIPAFALHGYALAGSVIGWEPTPIAFYLLGLLIGQSLLLLLSLTVIRRWRRTASPAALRLIAGLLLGLGLAFAWSAAIP